MKLVITRTVAELNNLRGVFSGDVEYAVIDSKTLQGLRPERVYFTRLARDADKFQDTFEMLAMEEVPMTFL